MRKAAAGTFNCRAWPSARQAAARAYIIALLLLTVAPRAISAQVTGAELNQTLNQLRISAIALSDDLFGERPGPGSRVARLRSAIEWLNNRAPRGNPADVSPEYVRSLQRAAALLRIPSRAIVEDVLEEMEAKVEHCRALGIGMGGTIIVRINTRRPAGPASDWQVLHLLKIYEHLTDASPVAFPRLSTPTEATLEPGRYWVWAREPSTGRTSERVLVRLVGQKELLVDLPVP